MSELDVVQAAFADSHKRLRIQKIVEILQKDIFYIDSGKHCWPPHPLILATLAYLKRSIVWAPNGCFLDSIIYVTRSKLEHPTGFIDTVAKNYGEGATITEYVSTAPGTYAYKVLKANGEGAFCILRCAMFLLQGWWCLRVLMWRNMWNPWRRSRKQPTSPTSSRKWSKRWWITKWFCIRAK